MARDDYDSYVIELLSVIFYLLGTRAKIRFRPLKSTPRPTCSYFIFIKLQISFLNKRGDGKKARENYLTSLQ